MIIFLHLSLHLNATEAPPTTADGIGEGNKAMSNALMNGSAWRADDSDAFDEYRKRNTRIDGKCSFAGTSAGGKSL